MPTPTQLVMAAAPQGERHSATATAAAISKVAVAMVRGMANTATETTKKKKKTGVLQGVKALTGTKEGGEGGRWGGSCTCTPPTRHFHHLPVGP